MFLCFTPATVDTADTLQWACLLKLSGKISQSPGKHFNLKSAFLLHTIKFASCFTHSHRAFFCLFFHPCNPWTVFFPEVFIFPWIVKPRHLNYSFFFSFSPRKIKKGGNCVHFWTDLYQKLKCLKLIISNIRSKSFWPDEKEDFSHTFCAFFSFFPRFVSSTDLLKLKPGWLKNSVYHSKHSVWQTTSLQLFLYGVHLVIFRESYPKLTP